jgi:hypothetical protein
MRTAARDVNIHNSRTPVDTLTGRAEANMNGRLTRSVVSLFLPFL